MAELPKPIPAAEKRAAIRYIRGSSVSFQEIYFCRDHRIHSVTGLIARIPVEEEYADEDMSQKGIKSCIRKIDRPEIWQRWIFVDVLLRAPS